MHKRTYDLHVVVQLHTDSDKLSSACQGERLQPPTHYTRPHPAPPVHTLPHSPPLACRHCQTHCHTRKHTASFAYTLPHSPTHCQSRTHGPIRLYHRPIHSHSVATLNLSHTLPHSPTHCPNTLPHSRIHCSKAQSLPRSNTLPDSRPHCPIHSHSTPAPTLTHSPTH